MGHLAATYLCTRTRPSCALRLGQIAMSDTIPLALRNTLTKVVRSMVQQR